MTPPVRVAGTATFFRPRKNRPRSLPGQMIVKVKSDAISPSLGIERLAFSYGQARKLPGHVAEPFRHLRTNAGLNDVSALFSARRAGLKRMRGGPVTRQTINLMSSVADSQSEDLSGISVVSLDPKRTDTELLKLLRASPVFEYVERMPARWLTRSAPAPDPLLNLQWGLRAIRWFQAKVPSARRINVAVLDSGVDENHPELDGVVDHYEHSGLSSKDIIGHGTHVAGIIAAEANNRVGIAGVARCRIKAWKVFPDKPVHGDFFVDGERYLLALNGVIAARAKVVNLSLGGASSSQTEALLFRRLEREGITVVAAVGNEFEEGNPVEYPAAYESVLAVGSVGENLRRSPFSNTGDHIDLVAPGSNILSTLPTSKSAYRDETEYAAWSGTSMATPHVAAVAALILAKGRGLSPKQVKDKLRKSTTRLKSMRKTWTPSYGAGLLNLERTLN